MIGNAVKHTSASGVESDALVLHEFTHDPHTGLADPRHVNLVVVNGDPNAAGAYGRALRIVESVPHRDAENADRSRGTWRGAGE